MPVRESVELAGHGHANSPIPSASRIGPFLATGGVRGADLSTGVLPEDAEAQTRHMFANLKALLAEGGASPDHILKMTLWVTDRSTVAHINTEWLVMFPDPASRPARHVLVYDLPGGMKVQCDALVIITEAL